MSKGKVERPEVVDEWREVTIKEEGYVQGEGGKTRGGGRVEGGDN